MPKKPAGSLAKQIAQEPLEILKTAGEQVMGSEVSTGSEKPQESDENQKKLLEHKEKLQDEMKSSRRVEALSRELEDIHKQDLFKDLQARITNGEEIPLEDYPELSLEQKQVLNAQMKAVRIQMENGKSANGKSLVEPAVKKGRQLLNFGKKQAVKGEQTRVERPVPPSG